MSQELIDIFESLSPSTPMSEDETKVMLNLLMSEDKNLSCNLDEIDKESDVYNHFIPLIESIQAQVFLSEIKISPL